MKFSCDNCAARYQIADEKARGRTLRMKCRRCGHTVLIHGKTLGPAPEPSADELITRPEDSQVGPLPRARTGREDSGVGPLPVRPSSAPRREEEPAPRPRTSSTPPAARPKDDAVWHVSIHDIPVGPITRDEVHVKIASGAVDRGTLCWREGFADWVELGEVPELSPLLLPRRSERPRAVPPPLPKRPPAPPASVPPPSAAALRASHPAPRPSVPAPRPSVPSPERPRPSVPPRPVGLDDAFPAGAPATRPSVAPSPAASASAFGATIDVRPSDVSSLRPSEAPPAELADELAALAATVPKPAPLPRDVGSFPPGSTGASSWPAPARPSLAPPGASIAPTVPTRGIPLGAWILGVIAVVLVGGLGLVVGHRMRGEGRVEVAAPPGAVPAAPPPTTVGPMEFEVPEEAPAAAESPSATEASPAAPSGARTRVTRRAGGAPAAADPVAPAVMRPLTPEEQARLAQFAGASEAEPTAIAGTAGEENTSQASRGPLSEADVRRVVGENRPSLQRCYDRAVRGRFDAPSVRLDVEIVVGASGTVTRAQAVGEDVGGIVECVERSVRRWRFPPSDGGQTRFPVVFSGS